MALSLFHNDPFFSDVWDDMRRLQRNLDRTFQELPSDQLWSPSCDVRETDNQIVLHAELPGIKKEDINIELKNKVLTISGERKHEKKEENEKYVRTERNYGKFVRSIGVPAGVTENDVKATFENGVLEVTFPKSVEKPAEKKRIAIQ